MFIPTWAFWVAGVLIWLAIMGWITSTGGDAYDFVTPLLVAVVFFAGLAFGVGYWIGS